MAGSWISVIMTTVRLLPFLAAFAVALLATSRPASTAGNPTPLRVMTYNLNFGNPDPKTTLDAIAGEDADIVLLQEITTEWRRALEARFAKQYPHQNYRVHARAAGGLAVLSKHPITAEDVWTPPRGGWFPASRLIVDSPFGALQILNLHLRPNVDGGSWVKGWHTTPPIRRREIEAYWRKVTPQLPTIVAGDFNEAADGKAIAFLAKQGLTRVPTTGPSTWHYQTWLNGKRQTVLSLDIDHVMIDGQLQATDARVLDAGTSDHRPVVVTVKPR